MKLLSFLFAASHFSVGVADLLQPSRRSTDSSPPLPLSSRYTLLIKARNHDVLDRILEEAPRYKVPYLTKAEVRELSGLHDDDIETLRAVVEVDLGGKLVHVSALADSVTFEVAPGVSRKDIIRILKDSSSAVSLEAGGGGSSLHDHVALIHRHRHGGTSSSSSSSVRVSSSETVDSAEQDIAAVDTQGSSRYLAFHSTCPEGTGIFPNPYSTYGFSTQELVNSAGLAHLGATGQFYVCCPNGDIESVNNTCSSSASLLITPSYPGSGNTGTPEQIKIENIESIRTIVNGTAFGAYDGVYLYTLPLNYFKANVLYSNWNLTVTTIDGVLQLPQTNILPNIFNATSASIKRELFGVPEKYQGSADQVQFTDVMAANLGNNYAYNVSAVSEYLYLQGVTDYKTLVIDDWAPPNTPNVCIPANSSGCSNILEQMLDVEALQSMAPKATTKAAPGYVNITDPSQSSFSSEDLLSIWNLYFETLLGEENPGVVSWSWGTNKFLTNLYRSFNDVNFQSSGENWVKAISLAEDMLKKMAAMGYTIFVASGDVGASGDGGACFSNAFNELGNTSDIVDFEEDAAGINDGYLLGNQLMTWPSYSEWVTSVGGTQMLVLDEGTGAVEVACSAVTGCGITSGGGFAGSAPPLQAVYKRPSWQDEQVQEYLNNNGPYTFPGFPDEFTVGYNSQGRAFPDLAAYAHRYPIISYSGEVSAVAGTSLSAPLTAGLITLVNQALLEQGYEKVGYMNPMLYWMAKFCPEAFNDIMFGNNQENESGNKCAYGFNAAPGWDPVTGLGSIKFESFVSCAIKYQTEQKANPTSMGDTDTDTEENTTSEPNNNNSAAIAIVSLFTSAVWVSLSMVFVE